jgi:hypothetical protein
MTGIEVAVGLLIAWAIKRANRVGARADEIAAEAIDVGLDRVHDIVVAKLGRDPSLARLEAEARDNGKVAERTRQRVRLALEDATTDDGEFAQRLREAVQKVKSVSASSTVNHATDSSVAVGRDVSGIVTIGNNATITQHS